jgi:acetyl esterase/lipase
LGRDEALNDHICRICEVAIVSPEYRLAPEGGVTFLDEIEDCLAASDGRTPRRRPASGPSG